MDDLDGLAVGLGEDGAQDFVAADNLGESQRQRPPVELPAQTDRHRHVIEGALRL